VVPRGPNSNATGRIPLRGRRSSASCVHDHLPWAREVPFQTVHSVSRFLSLSNNLGNLLFARQTTPMVVSGQGFDTVLIQRKGRCAPAGWTAADSLQSVDLIANHQDFQRGPMTMCATCVHRPPALGAVKLSSKPSLLFRVFSVFPITWGICFSLDRRSQYLFQMVF